jgi:hypothetical protein
MTDKALMLIAKGIPIPQQVDRLQDAEFSVFSQWGDDGIIQYIIDKIDISNEFFVEFGVENYLESNTRYLLMNNNWSGLIMDGSTKHVEDIKSAPYFWKHDLQAVQSFITCENILETLSTFCSKQIGLLHIDIDGMDYWIWQKISSQYSPDILILEYNSVFGFEKSITIPYQPNFVRHRAHHSGLYAGASLKALYDYSLSRGYAFLGSNSAGNNAYFVKKELLNNSLREVSLLEGYVASKFREARDKKGKLTFLRAEDRILELKGLPVLNLENGQLEIL